MSGLVRWLLARRLAANIERDYPDNALTSMFDDDARPTLCGQRNPAGRRVCVRAYGHGTTNMTLPDGRRTYVNHNTERDGSGEGWGA